MFPNLSVCLSTHNKIYMAKAKDNQQNGKKIFATHNTNKKDTFLEVEKNLNNTKRKMGKEYKIS